MRQNYSFIKRQNTRSFVTHFGTARRRVTRQTYDIVKAKTEKSFEISSLKGEFTRGWIKQVEMTISLDCEVQPDWDQLNRLKDLLLKVSAHWYCFIKSPGQANHVIWVTKGEG